MMKVMGELISRLLRTYTDKPDKRSLSLFARSDNRIDRAGFSETATKDVGCLITLYIDNANNADRDQKGELTVEAISDSRGS